ARLSDMEDRRSSPKASEMHEALESQGAGFNDFVIVVDTRESSPYRFKGEKLIHKKLDTGDYSVKGFEDRISIERKTHGDFLGSITRGRKRFLAEMLRMNTYAIKAVVIEAEFGLISRGAYPYAKVNPEAAIGTMIKIIVDFGIPVVTAVNRAKSEEFVLRMLRRSYLKMRGLK
ncbi:hypothetical protein KKE60_06570, partial [Patescibacteria group bacterium]|nr:hypothetical protein [Patescibacteria group bacterium]